MSHLYIGADHAGVELKPQIVAWLKTAPSSLKKKWQVKDMGTDSKESCDYPIFARRVVDQILKEPESLGLLICGTGIGMSIAANKVPGIRAAVVSDPKSAQMAREHNLAQILCLGARIIDFNRAKECIEAFLNAEFDTSNPRHQRRLDLISSFESEFSKKA